LPPDENLFPRFARSFGRRLVALCGESGRIALAEFRSVQRAQKAHADACSEARFTQSRAA
jgi:hypothetical protein